MRIALPTISSQGGGDERTARAGRRAVSKRRSWSTLIAWGVAIAVLTLPRRGHHRTAGADVAGSARHALLAGRSDAARQVRQHDPDRDPAARPARASSTARGSGWWPRCEASARSRCSRPGTAASTMRSLRPKPGAAFVLVNYIRPESRAMAVVPSTEAVIARTVQRPVHSYLTGVAVIGEALQKRRCRTPCGPR